MYEVENLKDSDSLFIFKIFFMYEVMLEAKRI